MHFAVKQRTLRFDAQFRSLGTARMFPISRSVAASIYVSEAETLLTYQYENEPNSNALVTMHAHEGTATLELGRDPKTLKGNYYSGRDRANRGTLVLTPKEKRLS